MFRPTALLCLSAALAACAPQVPDSAAGVGFGNYGDYIRQREAQAAAASRQPAAPVFSTDRVGAAISAAENPQPAPVVGAPLNAMSTQPAASAAPLPANRPRGNAPAGIQEQSGEMGIVDPATMSDEQDFSAVASRETIESDADRLARQRAQYEVVAPTSLPERSAETGPNIVQYALNTSHAPGTQLYKRSRLFARDPNVACSKYGSADLAQEAFLAAGGPERDRQGLDPDGDGFVCGWDPRPFRTALR
ncbi:MAG: hypothetical protein P8O10_08870 [Pseudorhodobacter sp.]|nr:hypothetical protein [Pseudorhodobacter sp.]